MRKIVSLMAITGMALFFSSCVRDRDPYPYPSGPVQRSFVDEFDDNRLGWNFADPANNAFGNVGNGIYMFDYEDDNTEAYYVSKFIGFNRNDDFTIYTRIRSNNNMGLLFGDNSSVGSYGYSFTVDYDGYYALYDEGGNGYGPDVQTLVAPATNPNVARNGNWNELRLEQRGGRWIGFVNDVQVFNIAAQQLRGTNVGFVDVKNTNGDADYLQVDWWE